MTTQAALTEEQIEQFHRDGYLALRGLLSQQDLQPLIDELAGLVDVGVGEAIEARVLAVEDTYQGAPFATRLALVSAASSDPGWIWQRYFSEQKPRTAGMFALRTAGALLDVVEALVGGEIYAHPQFNYRAKLPDQEINVIPWHQDLAYLNPQEAGDTLVVNAWIPLVEATLENGCMQVIRGSHLSDLIPHNYRETMPGHKGSRGITDDELPEGEIFTAELAVGDALLTTERLVHRGTPNTADTVRWSVDTRYCRVGLPTGREGVPGFIARSRQDVESVTRDHVEWNRIYVGSPKTAR